MSKSPILLHCSAGIGRTGTFCAIDIGIKRYLNEKTIDVASTVVKMRYERAGSVQTEDQYLFAHLALMDFIEQQQAIQERINNSERTKRKKSLIVDPTDITPLMNTSKIDNLEESLSHRVKTSSDSSLTTIQHLISSTNESSIEQIPPMSSINGNGINRKLRK